MEGTGESQSRSSSAPPLPPPFIGLGTTPMTPPPPPLEEGAKGKGKGKGKRRKLPSAKEMVAHYESQGMETQEASLKVIEDLQKLLFKVVTTKNKNKNNANNNNNVVDLNVVHSRLLFLESKLDSKPGYPQTLAIGVASGAAVRLFPHLAASVANIWNSIRASISPHPQP